MNLRRVLALNISRKDFCFVVFLVLNALTWNFMVDSLISMSLQNMSATDVQRLMIRGIYLLSIVCSGLVGASLFREAKRRRILTWIALSASVTFFSAFVFTSATSPESLGVVAFVYGASFGAGLPMCLAAFAEYTSFENRGHVGGITLFLTYLSVPFLSLSFTSDMFANAIVSASWRAIGLIIFAVIPTEKPAKAERGSKLTRLPFRNRAFLLYAIPWFMFCLIDRYELSVSQKVIGPEVISLSRVVEPLVGVFFVLIAGFISDWIGRKKTVVSGFISLGLAYAILGLAPFAFFSQIFYMFVDSVAWSIFTVMFVLVLWGDLASSGRDRPEKYYALGVIPFFIADFVRLLSTTATTLIPIEASFSLASLFLFVAVVPLMYTPETLPEKEIKERELKGYLDKAKKIKEKYT